MTYIFGHKRPDTDSVCAAISLSYLKNILGNNTEPRILDEINNETKYVLDYFGFKSPSILDDVKLQIKNINYKKDISIIDSASLFDAYNKMINLSVTALPIINNNSVLTGLISMKDIAKINFDFDSKLVTSYDNIISALEGESVLKFDSDITGNILVASYKSTTFIDNVHVDDSTVLIVGDRHSVIEYAVNNSAKLIIVTGDSNIKEEHLNIAMKNGVNIIKTSFDTYKVSRIINFANYVNNKTVEDVVLIKDTMLVDEFKSLNNKVKYSNYPVVYDNQICLGMIGLSDLSDKNPQKVILVDHNELSQSVDGIEEASIIEVIDHHKIGDIASKVPINFRNMTVGSTCTIIYLMFKEALVDVPKNVLGLLMSGIISDTMLLNSPTTTELDKKTLVDISSLLDIDYNKYGREMFHHGSSLKDKTLEEIIYNDFKKFNHGAFKIGIGQLMTTSIDELKKDFIVYAKELDRIATDNKYNVLALFVTDIIDKCSYIIYSSNCKDILEQAFAITDLEIGHCLNSIVSRKTQIVPPIIEYLDNI